MLRCLGTTLISVLLPTLALAGGYGYNGYYPNYSYNYGYQYVYHDAGYSGGRYYPAGSYYWDGYNWHLYGHNGPYYGLASAPTVAATPPAYNKDWKSNAIDFAKQKEDEATYLKTLGALGINYPAQGGAAYAAYPSPNFGTFGVNGSTLYGYTYETVRNSFGDLNLNGLYQQHARLAQQVNDGSVQLSTQFGSLVDKAGDRAGAVAEVLARGQAASSALQSARPSSSTTTSTKTTLVSPTPPPVPEQPAPAVDPQGAVQVQEAKAFLERTGVPACGKCHGDKEPKAKFSILAWPTLDTERKHEIRKWLLDEKEDSACAGNKKGYLKPEQKIEFMTH